MVKNLYFTPKCLSDVRLEGKKGVIFFLLQIWSPQPTHPPPPSPKNWNFSWMTLKWFLAFRCLITSKYAPPSPHPNWNSHGKLRHGGDDAVYRKVTVSLVVLLNPRQKYWMLIYVYAYRVFIEYAPNLLCTQWLLAERSLHCSLIHRFSQYVGSTR